MKITTKFGTVEIKDEWRQLMIQDIDNFGFDLPKLREALEKGTDIELNGEESEKFVMMIELLDAWYGGGMTD